MNCCKATLDSEQVKKLFQMVAEGIPKTDVAEHFGISRQDVYRILKEQKWYSNFCGLVFAKICLEGYHMKCFYMYFENLVNLKYEKNTNLSIFKGFI